MALQFRRGAEAIRESATRKSGNFRPFIPQVYWKEDGDSRYVLVLTDIAEVARVVLHSFIPVGKDTRADGEEYTRWEEFLSRKDPAIGEPYDELEDRLEREPKIRHVGIMVELEPVMEKKGERQRLQHFIVKTETFTRNTDDGEVEVTAPVIGICAQSAITLWGALESLNESEGPLAELPIKITRRGKKAETRYDITPYLEKAVDLSPLITHREGITYLSEEEQRDLDDVLAAEESEIGQAQTIAELILTKRLEELADKERYDELVNPLTLDDMPKNAWGRKVDKKGKRPARAAQRSQAEVAEPTESEPSRTDRFAALKAKVESGQ